MNDRHPTYWRVYFFQRPIEKIYKRIVRTKQESWILILFCCFALMVML